MYRMSDHQIQHFRCSPQKCLLIRWCNFHFTYNCEEPLDFYATIGVKIGHVGTDPALNFLFLPDLMYIIHLPD